MKLLHLLLSAALTAALLAGGAAGAQEDPCADLLPPQARQPGSSHATVVSPAPLDLRAGPSQDADLLGQVEPGETVIAFHDTACDDGLLWREVVDDGLQGWTAEADAEAYFLVPFEEPEPVVVSTIDDGMARVTSDLLSFSIDAEMADTVLMTQQPGYSYREAMSLQPEYRFYEIGATTDGEFTRVGHISVWVGRDWSTVIGGWAEGQVWKLRYLMDNQVPLPEVDETGAELNIPVLPVPPAVQLLRAQPRYLDFEGGLGLRFVTHYTQMTGQVYGFFDYYYMGITEGGEYVIAGYVPVTVPENTLPPFDDARFIAEYEDPSEPGEYYTGYVAEVTASLNALEPNQFIPSLEKLDALFASITVALD